MVETPSHPIFFPAAPPQSVRDCLYCFLHNFVHDASRRDDQHFEGFFQSPSAMHLTKSFSVSNVSDVRYFRDAQLVGMPNLARIQLTISTENFVTSDLSHDARLPLINGWAQTPANGIRRYNFVVSAKFYDHRDYEIDFVDQRTQTALDIRETSGWSMPHPNSADMGPLLGRLFTWPSVLEMVKHNAIMSTYPPGTLRVDNPLANMGILGNGSDFRPA